jgi:hypothetical protein
VTTKTKGAASVAPQREVLFYCNNKPLTDGKYFFRKTVTVGPDLDVYRKVVREQLKEDARWIMPIRVGPDVYEMRYTVRDSEPKKSS